MRKNWIRSLLIAAVVGAAGLGWLNHAHLSGNNPSMWLASISGTQKATPGSASHNHVGPAAVNSSGSGSTENTNTTSVAMNGSANVTSSRTGTGASPGLSEATRKNTGTSSSTKGAGAAAKDTSAATNGAGSQTQKMTQTQVAISPARSQMGGSSKTSEPNTAKGTSTSSIQSSSGPSTSAKSTTTTTSTGKDTTTSASSGTTTSASSGTSTGKSVSFTIIVSENHGQTVLSKKTITIHQGENLMQYMQQNYNIQTAYGGDFIVAINGIHSQWTGVPISKRQPVDWFLYVNQQQAPVGAASIIPRAGDVDDWDYHRWNPSTGQG